VPDWQRRPPVERDFQSANLSSWPLILKGRIDQKATDTTSGHTNAQEIQQEDFQLPFAASPGLVEANMDGSHDERQYGIDENA
jgi:hypothetical protein